mgnify:CR=1 FL=1
MIVRFVFVAFAGMLAAADLPHHLIHPTGRLTAPDRRPASDIARDFIRTSAGSPAIADSLYIAKEYRTQHNGVTHIVYQQQYRGLDVFSGEWVVNLDAQGQVLNAGGKLYDPPAGDAQVPGLGSLDRAVRLSLETVDPSVDARTMTEVAPRSAVKRRYQFAAAGQAAAEGQPVWYPVRGRLEPAWLIYATAQDGIETEEVIVAAAADRVLHRDPMTWHQAPRGLVYTGRSPQPTPQPGTKLEAEPPYVQRELVPLVGDPIASPKGWFAGNSTAGNNTITGINLLATSFTREPILATSPTLDFQFPLELGTGAPNPSQFRDAASTNLFYWTNLMHDFFYGLGFDEAAGNYQEQNFGRGGVGGDPMLSYGHCGAQSTFRASLNNAFYSTRTRLDGGQAMICMFLGSSAGRWADGAYSTETIIHEYTHGVTFRLVRGITGHQGGAMNEAFSDFWALEFLTPEGAPPDGIYPYGEYLYNTFGVGIRSRPYSTNLSVNPLTYRDLGRAANFVSVHNDGGIWVMSLWEIRANLIAQFGEREGRRRLRRNVLDGMKLAPPGPSMVDLRDAILLADRVNFRGESQTQMWAAFAKRGLGVLAFSNGADSIVVDASYDVPSARGRMAFRPERPSIGETVTLRLHDANLTADALSVQVVASSGDIETIPLRRQGSFHVGTVFTTLGATARESGTLSVITGDSITAFYNDADAGPGFRQIAETARTMQPYANSTLAPLRYEFTGERALNFRQSGNAELNVTLPFDFPYYDRKVSLVKLSPAGQILFDTVLAPSCFDRAAIQQQMGIWPMGAWLRTNGNAQPNEDIYSSRPSPDAVTFRWVAETAPLFAGVFGFVPEPVNFAVTLFEDGRIRYQYGPTGNTNVVNTQQFFGSCEAGLPVVGISRGNGTGSVLPISHNGRANFATAPPIEFLPGFGQGSLPEVLLESPAPGATAAGLIEVRGIATDSATFIGGATILIDGVYRAQATTGVSRPDICNTQRLPGCPFVGLSATLNAGALGLAPGRHTLQLRVTNTRGGFTDHPAEPVSFEVTGTDQTVPVGRIEAPADGATVRGNVTVTGFAYARGLRVNAVEVLMDDLVYGRAAYGLQRADLCAGEASGAPNCPGLGFTFGLNTTAGVPTLTNGPHQLRLRLIDATGRFTLLPARTIVVDNPANLPPEGALTAPVNGDRVSGTIRVTGHAYDPDGRVTQVQLLIDGGAVAALPYGQPRPEVCAGLTGIAACPAIGFEGEFNTKTLSNGLHRIGVRFIDTNGASVVVPRTTSGGVNVFVEN